MSLTHSQHCLLAGGEPLLRQDVIVGGSDPYMANTEIPGYEYPVPKKYFGLS